MVGLVGLNRVAVVGSVTAGSSGADDIVEGSSVSQSDPTELDTEMSCRESGVRVPAGAVGRDGVSMVATVAWKAGSGSSGSWVVGLESAS